jgi:hypothetical protein
LFVRQSSGLVREVSVRNALFYNTAAFIGITVAWAPVFYTLALVPIGKVGPLTSYGVTAILVGICCVFLGLIFASLATVMPRSGGDYVFTSRLIPGVGPFFAWVESFTLVFASLAVIAFEIPIVLHNTQISGDIIGIGTGVGFFKRANGWFTSGGSVTSWPGMIAALVVIALILLVVIPADPQVPPDRHRARGVRPALVGRHVDCRAAVHPPCQLRGQPAPLHRHDRGGAAEGRSDWRRPRARLQLEHDRAAVPDERGPVPVHRIPVLRVHRR